MDGLPIMNKQGHPGGIEWTDFSWNPVTGCQGPKGDGVRCSYCYANRLAHGRLRALYLANDRILAGNPLDPFAPRFWAHRLGEPFALRKPSRIFVCDMADLFGGWVSPHIIESILSVVRHRSEQTFQFLTKWPQNLAQFNPWPANAWVGATTPDGDEAYYAAGHLAAVEAPVRFMSLEPLLGHIDTAALLGLEWVIVGAQTGPGARPPDPRWIEQIARFATQRGIPLFQKNNLGLLNPRQEWPR